MTQVGEPIACSLDRDSALESVLQPICDIESARLTEDSGGPDPWLDIKERMKESGLLKEEPPEGRFVEIAPFREPGVTRRVGTFQVIALSTEKVLGGGTLDDRKTRKLKLEINSSVGFCGAHPITEIQVPDGAPALEQPATGARTYECEVAAAPMWGESFQALDILAPFDFARRIWRDPDELKRQYLFTIKSHGSREGSSGIRHIMFIVDVYPMSALYLKIEIPAFLSKTGEAEISRTRTRMGGSSTDSVSVKTSGKSLNKFTGESTAQKSSLTAKSTTMASGATYHKVTAAESGEVVSGGLKGSASREASVGAYNSASMSALTASTAGRVKIADGELEWEGFKVTLLYNNSSLVATLKKIQPWLEDLSKIKKTLKAIKQIQDLLNGYTYGWKLSGTIDGLFGEASVAYGFKEIPKEHRVAPYCGVEIDLTIVHASVTGTFGIAAAFGGIQSDVSADDWNELVKVELALTIEGKLSLSGKNEQLLGVGKSGGEVKLTGEIPMKLEASFALIMVISIQASVRSAIVAEGAFVAEINTAPELKYQAKMKSTIAALKVRIRFFTAFHKEVELISEFPLSEEMKW